MYYENKYKESKNKQRKRKVKQTTREKKVEKKIYKKISESLGHHAIKTRNTKNNNKPISRLQMFQGMLPCAIGFYQSPLCVKLWNQNRTQNLLFH